jgi:hypothetical protein
VNDAFDNAQTDKEALVRYGESLTHAITVHQPYAWALAAGHKPVENRTWRPPLWMVGRLIGIHAGKLIDGDAYHGLRWGEGGLPERPGAKALTLGAFIGVARLVGVVFERKLDGAWPNYHRLNGASKAILDPLPLDLQARIRPWWRGPWGWLLEEAVLLPEPIPMRGQQGLWRISGSFSGPSYDEEVGAWPMTYAAWALEQWRKAREGA